MAFPSTHWSMIAAVQGSATPEQRAALDRLMARYRYPAYVHLRAKNISPADAEDLVQDFFTSWLQKNLFGSSNATRGRFRSFFLTSLNNFVRNAWRDRHAQRRWPSGGFSDEGMEHIVDERTPESEFLRAFASGTTRAVLAQLEAECRESDQHAHYTIFRRRIVEPALDGAEPPSFKALAEQFQMSEKQATNCLVTMKRAYRRLLDANIRDYAASSEDARLELAELMGHLRIVD